LKWQSSESKGMKKHWLVWSMIAAMAGLIIVVFVLVPRLGHHRQVEALNDESPAVRAAAVRALPREGNEQLLIDRLKDADPDVRLLAAQRLGGRGPKGAERAWAIIGILNDAHIGVRREAAWSLGVIGADAWPALRKALDDENPRVRAGAALALEDAYKHKEPEPWPSQQAKEIAPILKKLLSDADPEVRRNAEEALGSIGR
jgi:HEAT repeat protein